MTEEQDNKERKGLKRAVIIGSILGAFASLAAALAMDVVLGSSLQGTWWDASQRDVTKMFGPGCGQNPFAVGLMLAFVMGFLAAFGAFLGMIAGVFMYRLFRFVLK
ncbi:MAG: hypothetical protein A2X56_00260 [Nitrospirae bacterium GWC2_57_13]|jgi:hypothetical protein|nr:MAG: hypothetical protein A2072_08695 [Nitrospirae bacterium GWC1_57_7]OGW28481.1 MAG: hypothetical protein A2X56_00260 [Nitrospirae bacterium GWC2_57_13]OGW46014.1 MAG: hypothetical protein A2X57_10100 [Nitrospirae bacterium GWD2_57_8]HAR46581.1 hypothetical protein [Nitrospiraceae bacterium]HAS53688.1 hypothetical protein [Nitrospiraceae bacterium]